MPIRSVTVLGIFDRQDITFDFRVSPLFIVGPNGTGKSTALKIFHSLLSAQWSRMQLLPFVGIEIDIDGTVYYLEKSDFLRIDRLRAFFSRASRRPIRKGSTTLPIDWELARSIIEGRDPNTRRAGRIFSPVEIESFASDYEILSLVSNTVDRECVGHVLYFPTYRRVERELGELLEYEDSPFDEEPSIGPAVADRFHVGGEVVGFGGQDIGRLLADTAALIEVRARAALNEHSVRFLEALATRKTEETRMARAVIRSGDRTERLLQRLAAFSPSSIDMNSIRESVDTLRNKLSKAKPGRLTQQQDMLLFYVSEMITLIDRIDELSRPLVKFAELIDRYVRPVKRAYLRESDNSIIIEDKNGNEIKPGDLSSGEKQIVAFFAFLFLKPQLSPRYIIIDEPELSLSVSWQRTLIHDFIDFNSSAFLVSATHSPFIFENFSIDNVLSLGDL